MVAPLLALALAVPPPDAALSVRCGRHHGSAIVWDRDAGLVLTALHVVEEAPAVEVALASGVVPARVVDRDPALDLALLRVDAPLPPALPVADAAAGEPVSLAACPALRCGAAPATVRDPLLRFAGSRYVELVGHVPAGASGGAVVDARGAIVGIVDLALRGRGVGLAVPAARALARFPRAAP